MNYNSGDLYDGGWKKGKKNGNGIYRFLNGMVHDGNWNVGNEVGKGMII